MKYNANIKIIDSIMGSGKTTFAFNMFNDQTGLNALKRYIYATPRSKEVERALDSVEGRTFEQPEQKHSEGTKKAHFMKQVKEGRDIATTHQLLERLTVEDIAEIEKQGYTLVLDEAPQVYEQVALCDCDLEMLEGFNHISVDKETNRVEWINAEYPKTGAFNDLRELLERPGICYADKQGDNTLVFTMDPSFWEAFSDVYLMMYLYDGQFVKSYFELYGIEVTKYAVANGVLVDYDVTKEGRESHYALMKFRKHKTFVGEGRNDLSTGYLKDSKRFTDEAIKSIKDEMYNFSRTTKVDDIIWTCHSEFEDVLQGKGYKNGYIPYTERATNAYKDCTTLMYIGNRFANPNDTKFFTRRGIEFNYDLFAVSEALQWIYRGAIRDGKEVRILMPSSRMRDLIKKWASYEI